MGLKDGWLVKILCKGDFLIWSFLKYSATIFQFISLLDLGFLPKAINYNKNYLAILVYQDPHKKRTIEDAKIET